MSKVEAIMRKGMLIFFCGKMGSGKTTVAHDLARRMNGVRFGEDEWLGQLFPNKIATVADYKHYSDLIKPLVKETAQKLLNAGVNVVLDFPGNTVGQRQWLKSISDEVFACHRLILLDTPTDECLARIKKRANPITDTEEMFGIMLKFFTVPTEDEGLVIEIVNEAKG